MTSARAVSADGSPEEVVERRLWSKMKALYRFIQNSEMSEKRFDSRHEKVEGMVINRSN